METLRFASPALATHYPLPSAGSLDWSPTSTGWCAQITLPVLPADHIVVPSLASYDQATACEYELHDGAHSWCLCPYAADCNSAATSPDVTTHIDYFHVRAPLAAPVLTVKVASAQPPHDYLLCVSARPFRHSPATGSAITERLVVPALSQLTAPRAIRRRICSPACVTMTLAYHGRAATLADVSAACWHAPSKLYGVWPLAIDCFAAHDVAAAVECFSDLDTVAGLLGRGLPVVASIRFGAGLLPDAPLSETGGHLVVVTGMSETSVHVNDPAARDAREVPRSYPRDAFATAWLTERGVGYVASPLR